MLINGVDLATQSKRTLTDLIKKYHLSPKLAVIVVGDDPASQRYVRNKERDCREVGIDFERIAFKENVGAIEVMAAIHACNMRQDTHGIIVQLPLPKHLNANELLNCIAASKDVDSLSRYHVGELRMTNNQTFAPCTPMAVLSMLKALPIELEGATCTIIGRSNLVGLPLAYLLTQAGATVTVCHSKTKNLAAACRNADILVSAAGKAGLVTADMVKDGATVIDVGINQGPDGKLCGDVCFEEVRYKAAHITPVPGGVGPMTRVMLLSKVVSVAAAMSGVDLDV